jgi:hypothetical protein
VERNRGQTEWRPEQVDELKKLWHEGKSATVAAQEMSRMFGLKITRNAIIGKIHRLVHAGVMLARENSRPQEVKDRTSRPRRPEVQDQIIAPASVARQTAPVKVAPTVPIKGNVIAFQMKEKKTGPGLLEDVSGCLYSIGVNAKNQHVFCNDEKQDGSAYCPDHHAMCYLPTAPVKILKAKKWQAL